MFGVENDDIDPIDSFQGINGIENIVNKEKALEKLNMSLTDTGQSLLKLHAVSSKNKSGNTKQDLDVLVLLFISL